MEKNNLFNMFCEVEDFRRKQGKMHSLPIILIIATMVTMSGYKGIRPIGDFIKKHEKDLIKILKPKNNKLPSYKTVSRVFINIDFNKLSDIFYNWAIDYVDIKEGEWLSLDGKAIRGTVKNPNNQYQEYVNLVSIFANKKKQVISVGEVAGEKKARFLSCNN